MKRSLAALLLVLLTAASAPGQQPPPGEPLQQPPFGERLDVNAVLIDAIVTDSRGNQILGLEKGDFVVTEDGVPQTLDSLDYFTSRRLLSATEANAPFKVEQLHEQRYFIFFFDKPNGAALFNRLALARAGVKRFLEKQMTEADRVAIVGHDVRLKVYTDFTADRVELRRALDAVAKFGNGTMTPPPDGDTPSILRKIDPNAMMSKTGTTYEALTVLADALQPIRARKNLVLFSPGIHEPEELVRDGVLLTQSRFYQPMIEALNEANVSVFSMNLLPDAPSDPVFHQTLESLSRETNGDYYRYAVTYQGPITQVAKAAAGYYMLTYRNHHGGRGYQKVSVSIRNHPEFHVAARSGYTYGY